MAAPPTAFPHRIGRIIRAHGLQGRVLVQLFRPRPIEPEDLEYHRESPPTFVEVCFDDGREVVHTLLGVRFANPSGFVARLEGVDTREDAERLIGAFVDVAPQNGPSVLDEVDRVFGGRVVDVESGRELGTIDDIRDNGAQALIVVGDDEILIPWVDEFIDTVEEGEDPVVHVRPIPGLLDVNER